VRINATDLCRERRQSESSSGVRLLSRHISIVLILLAMVAVCQSQVNVTTQRNDNGRTGQNLAEFLLSPGNVNVKSFGRLFSFSVDGYVYAQPLYLHGVNIPNKGVHNVVYVATEHDSVYAFDADSNTGANALPLWQVNFTNPASGIKTINMQTELACADIVPEVGITGTPVIDTSSNTLYVVARTKENGLFVQRLHALDVTTGAEKFGGPVSIQAQVPGTGVGSSGGFLAFDTLQHNQRPGLLLRNGLVYIAWAGHCDRVPYHGWVMAYDAHALNQVAAWAATPNGQDGGVWQSGIGLAADTNYVFLTTGNGTFSADQGGSDFGDTLVKLAPPSGGTFSDADYFTPFNQAFLSQNDWDLSSGGVVLLPDQPANSPHPHLMVAGGKEGTLYLVDRDSLGKFSPTLDQNVQSLYAITGRIFGSPVWWNNNLYLAGNKKPLVALTFDPTVQTFNPTPTSATTATFNFPSPSPAVSSSGAANGIVWLLDNHGFGSSSPTVLHAYDATNLANELYNSTQSGTRDVPGPAVKFTVPTIANGRVYVGAKNKLSVMGLFPTVNYVAGNNQTGIVGTVLPVPLEILAVDPYSGNPISGATITFNDNGALGKFSLKTVVTDSAGMASTVYTLPAKPKTATVTASSPGYSSFSFTETSLVGPPTQVAIVSGNNQTGPPSTPLPLPLTVKVKDWKGNGLPGLVVNFTDSGAGGSLSASQVTTDSSGLASVIYTTPGTTGNKKVKGNVAGVQSTAIFKEVVQ